MAPNKNTQESFDSTCLQLKNKLHPDNHEIIKILTNLLNFNPYFRMTAYEVI